ncbi:hypothetical protein MKS88_000593 [Plasmodium brasilianum]|uniref:Uncharacterized protein n=1 Tax=Plasmodium brasilianum TaxID=5824 RepID=A0ACB9YHN4_PLABR|nr:hypothetical protein MKS88_000593 [Plasmodium brasilianum]
MLIMSDEDKFGISLPSTINYNILDKKTSYYSDSICINLDGDLRDYEGIFDFCINIKGVNEKFNDLSFYGEFTDDRCVVVKFWLYDRLFNLRNKGQEVTNIENIITKIKTIINKDDEINKCNLFDFPYSKEDFDKMKSVYDYATNYSTVETYLKDKSFICNQNLSNYINGNYEIYISTKNSCNSADRKNIGYCKVFEHLKEPYIHENLQRLLCTVKSVETSVRMEEHLELSRVEGPPETLELKHSLPFSNIIMAFTPFKSWLKSHLLKKKIIQFYEDEEYIQEHLNKNYRTDRRHIRYYPL